MSITFRTPEDALAHYRDEHDGDCEWYRLVRAFDFNETRTYATILGVADLLHEFGYLRGEQAILDFFEKPYNYTEDAWAAACDAAGIDTDTCDECD